MNYPCPYKLRAWNGSMHLVESVSFNAGGAIWYSAGNTMGWAWINPDHNGWDQHQPKPSAADICPMMRWTGLVDKNGVDIWEGDILSNIRGTPAGVVTWGTFPGFGSHDSHDEATGWYVKVTDEDGEFRFALEDSAKYPHTPKSGLVLGNVHQTPDLLK
jgi:uncharacterized phage protein (TIGR01671 family)